MAITSGFFNSVGGDRKYTPEDFGHFLHGLISSGVYAESSTSLQVLANDGMEVEVQPGRAMLDFHWLNNDGPLTFTLSPGGSQDRIDAIVAYVDMSTRVCDIFVKQGTPAAAPTPPTMERSDVRKEYMLAKVHVSKLATAVTQSSITATRADTTVCGWVTGLIKQVDTATLFLQWQTAYEEAFTRLGDYLAAQQAAWETFFASVTEDLVLPAPSLDDAGKPVMVNDTGDGYKLGDLAAEDCIKSAAPVNLLDNSDFTNPVNQRGATTYAQPGYTIDRWKTASAKLPVYLEDGGVLLESLAASGNLLFFQRLPVDMPAEKNYTMAVELADGNLYTVTGQCFSTTGKKVVLGDMGEMQSYKASAGDTCAFAVYPGKSMQIVWAALYEGEYTAETLPKYRPKGYAAELQVCQRYFINNVGPGLVGFYLASGNQLRVLIPTPAPMRTKPTVTLANSDSIVANVSGTTHVANVSAAVVSNVHNNGVTVTLTTDKTPGAYVPGALYSGFNLELSADL